MPVNLNPPPLPTPETARSAQPTPTVDDDPVSADLFAQLVAAAAMNGPPLAPASTPTAETISAGERDAPPAPDALPVEWTLALAASAGAVAVAAPIAIERSAQPASVDASGADVPLQDAVATAAQRDAARATGRFAASVEEQAPAPTAMARGDTTVAHAASTLRERFAAALTPRPMPIAAQPMSALRVPEAAVKEIAASTPARAPAPAPAVSPASTLAAAVDRNRVPAAPDAAVPVDAPVVASTPAASIVHAPAHAQPAQVVIQAAVGSSGFADEVATKIAHVVVRHERAELRVSPPELGPVEIRIDFKSDSASLTIVAPQPATRDALEQALPQLRESLAAQGIALGQTAIHDGRAQSDTRAHDGDAPSPRSAERELTAEPIVTDARIRLTDRLVDTFA